MKRDLIAFYKKSAFPHVYIVVNFVFNRRVVIYLLHIREKNVIDENSTICIADMRIPCTMKP